MYSVFVRFAVDLKPFPETQGREYTTCCTTSITPGSGNYIYFPPKSSFPKLWDWKSETLYPVSIIWYTVYASFNKTTARLMGKTEKKRQQNGDKQNKNRIWSPGKKKKHMLKKQLCELLLTPMCANSLESMCVGVCVCVFYCPCSSLLTPFTLKKSQPCNWKACVCAWPDALPAAHIIESMPCVMWHRGFLQQLFPILHCNEWALWSRRRYRGSNALLCLNIRH